MQTARQLHKAWQILNMRTASDMTCAAFLHHIQIRLWLSINCYWTMCALYNHIPTHKAVSIFRDRHSCCLERKPQTIKLANFFHILSKFEVAGYIFCC